ncbi:MAG: gamma-glutamyl-gamma-aminobutyrate hydrolase family protein [Bacilli bacterium]|nr:gamma-glutamyl-gamma-aminobutyrate hydrolase family protein [Bacilli bacterium]MBN2876862.1 gamma-glutamyl-gamma-aminobutyrate hydrolase family protein [Bacilli bacterium]
MKKILLVDYGSYYFKDVVQCMAELNVDVIEYVHSSPFSDIEHEDVCGIILTGSPGHVYNPEDPQLDLRLLDLKVPVLGICYGMQLLMHTLGGNVGILKERDYGSKIMTISKSSPINKGLSNPTQIWMAHYDYVTDVAPGYDIYASTDVSIAMIGNEAKQVYGIQYHPEATKTKDDYQILQNFVFDICQFKQGGQDE